MTPSIFQGYKIYIIGYRLYRDTIGSGRQRKCSLYLMVDQLPDEC